MPASVELATLPASVADSRDLIDAIDDEIIALLARRLEVSQHIQGLRASNGEGRVVQSREYDVMSRYRKVLERPGARVAVSILELCRGTR